MKGTGSVACKRFSAEQIVAEPRPRGGGAWGAKGEGRWHMQVYAGHEQDVLLLAEGEMDQAKRFTRRWSVKTPSSRSR